ncbi:MAG: YqhA family protein [Candidatus Berkiellales bacterium]
MFKGNIFRRLFENILMISRYFVLLPVVFGILSSILLFMAATIDIISMLFKVIKEFIHLSYPEKLHKFIVSEIIGAVDLYLIAIVLLIFSFGLYELFITKISLGLQRVKVPSILAIHSLDELKDKLAKVIVMVLVVNYFQRVLYITYDGALQMMYFALSISALSIGVYLLHKEKFKFSKQKTQESVPTVEQKR